MNFKNLLKKRVIIWGASTIVLVGVMITANILGRSIYNNLLDQVFGGKTAILAEDSNGLKFEKQKFFTKKDALENGNKTVEEICEEGMILLKNDNALPLKNGAKVSVFGKNSVNLVLGGSGSAAPGGNAKRKTIFDSLTTAGFDFNPELKAFYESSASGDGRSKNPAMDTASDSMTLKTGETPYKSYTDKVKNSYDKYGDAALVVFSRIAGETWDLPRVASDDPTRNYLELDNNERDLLKNICDSGKFQHVIVLLNGSNYMDLGFLKMTNDPAYDAKIDACINIGSPGGNGIMALGRILNGKVNPSGHTVDTVYTNYKNDPTWQNFGGNFSAGGDQYLITGGTKSGYYTVDYEENIYLGYRYYETRGHEDGEEWYSKNVVYPFGYGLSYTTFEQEVLNKEALQGAALSATEPFDVQIKVTNTGNVAGKQVVQLYAEAPYTKGGIEKSYKVLVGFAKTKLLAKGESDTVTIKVTPYDFASFDSRDMNNNNFKGYELEKGNYVFHAGTDAHHDFDTFTKNLAADAKFEKDPVTGTTVVPLFDEITTAMKESLSRSNFAATFPHTITDEERTISVEFLQKLRSFETTNEEVYDKLPTMGAEVTMNFMELAGAKFDDPRWETFLNQLTFDEMLQLFNLGCYSTSAVLRLGIPYTTSADGPTGFVAFLGKPEVYDTCYYCSECLVAQTYNLDLAAKQADAIGNESLVGNEAGDQLSYPGWYAPAVNLHRSPFSGRNTEYYSEDPFINGKFAATVIKNVQEYGVYCNVKHFALNDQETHRDANGIATWCDEQAMRELYLKPFEMAVKEGGSRGLMSSFNRIGTEWAGGSYRLLTTILRKEWGFTGSVICDYHTTSSNYMDCKQMLYAGGDLNLAGEDQAYLQTSSKYGTTPVHANDAKDANLLRQSAHRLLYSVANSNAMKGEIIGYNEATWVILLNVGTIAVSVGLVAWGAAAIITALRKKEEAAK